MDSRLRRIADYLLARAAADEVRPAEIGAALLPLLYVLDVERPGGAGLRLRVRLIGTALNRVFGRRLEGLYMEDFLHGPRGAEVIEGFHDSALRRAPCWMRQVVRIKDKLPRFVEGVAIPLAPDRLYGGLLIGELAIGQDAQPFERVML